MKQQINRLYQFWIYSNIHIAIIAAALSYESNLILRVNNPESAPIFVFFSTILIYNLGYYKAVFSTDVPFRSQARWMSDRPYFWRISMVLSLIAVLVLMPQFSLNTIIAYLFFGSISILYVLDDIKVFGLPISVRRIPYLKVFIVALTWSSITIIPQVIDSSFFYDSDNWKFLFIERFLFILAITLMFDIRDVNVDPSYLKTIPMSIGIRNTKLLSMILIFVATIGLLGLDINLWQLIGVFVVYSITLVLVYYSSPDNDDIYYSGLLDGVMGLHVLPFIIFKIIA